MELASQVFIKVDCRTALLDVSECIYKIILKAVKRGYREIVFVCIGTDRSTGDSLGPLIGYKLSSLNLAIAKVYGTLENPVHAKNLNEVLQDIRVKYSCPFIIAIDACLGKMDHVGYLSIGEGSIKPGAGVKKELGEVGDAYITGIVNFGGLMDFLILQNTRLSVVMKMADVVTAGIRYAISRIERDEEIKKYLKGIS